MKLPELSGQNQVFPALRRKMVFPGGKSSRICRFPFPGFKCQYKWQKRFPIETDKSQPPAASSGGWLLRQQPPLRQKPEISNHLSERPQTPPEPLRAGVEVSARKMFAACAWWVFIPCWRLISTRWFIGQPWKVFNQQPREASGLFQRYNLVTPATWFI